MTFGEKLRRIRVINGMTQEDLAKRVSLEKMSISKYESGKMMPSSSALVALCNVFGVGADYFFHESEVHIKVQPQFRTTGKSRLSKTDRARITQETEQAVGNLLEISEICPGSRTVSSPENLRKRVEGMDEIEDLAEDVRRAWALGDDPIENLMEVAENNGFTVILVDGPAGFDAAVFNDASYGPIIALKRGVRKGRQRFTLAHELGHYFICNEDAASNTWNPETRANRFAAALLVPRENLKKDIGNERTSISSEELCMLRDKYGISIQALLARMESLGIIGRPLKAKLDAYEKAGLFERSCDDGMHEEPRLARKLVYRAVAEGYISERKGIELLAGNYFGTSTLGIINGADA